MSEVFSLNGVSGQLSTFVQLPRDASNVTSTRIKTEHYLSEQSFKLYAFVVNPS